MWTDEIVEEIRKARDVYATRFDYDLTAIYQDLKEQQDRAEHKIVTIPPTKPVLLTQSKAF
jgi:beta-N-acetylglucosaminidase